jgi:hypothetical protein
VERNRRWILPLLGAAVLGVVFINVPSRAGEVEPPAAPAMAEAEAEAANPEAAPSLARDFRFLETPGPAEAGLLLQRGHGFLGAALRDSRRPALHPGLWGRLPGIPVAPEPRVPGVARAAAQPPPPLDFLIETGAGREAWIKGVGYRPGATLQGGYRLKEITDTGVVLGGPAGEVVRPLRSKP